MFHFHKYLSLYLVKQNPFFFPLLCLTGVNSSQQKKWTNTKRWMALDGKDGHLDLFLAHINTCWVFPRPPSLCDWSELKTAGVKGQKKRSNPVLIGWQSHWQQCEAERGNKSLLVFYLGKHGRTSVRFSCQSNCKSASLRFHTLLFADRYGKCPVPV